MRRLSTIPLIISLVLLLQAAAAHAAGSEVDAVNLRATAGFVTDAANETYCLQERYPVRRAGLTMGWVALTVLNVRNRNASVDHRLAGTHFLPGVNADSFRIDLPHGAGQYAIHIAAGDAGNFGAVYLQLQDDTTPFATINAAYGVGHFRDATGTDRTVAAWPGSEQSVTHVFNTGTLRVRCGNGTSADSCALNHVRVEFLGLTPTPTETPTITPLPTNAPTLTVTPTVTTGPPPTATDTPAATSTNAPSVTPTASKTATIIPTAGLVVDAVNLRASTGFVTDAANETYCLQERYPVRRAGLTMGWVALTVLNVRDRNAIGDRRLAGTHFLPGVNADSFRVDLPYGAGQYAVHVAAGDASNFGAVYLELQDDTVPFATISAAFGVGHFRDATGADRTAAAWPGGEQSVTHVFTTGTLRVRCGNGTNADTCTLNHVRVEFLGPTPTPTDTPTITPLPTNVPTPTVTPTVTIGPSPTVTDTPAAAPTNTPTRTPTGTPTRTPTAMPPASNVFCSDGGTEAIFKVAASGDDGYAERYDYVNYPPTANNLQDTTNVVYFVENSHEAGGWYDVRVGLNRWNTATQPGGVPWPANTVITSAAYRGRYSATEAYNTDGDSTVFEWYAWTPPISDAHWTLSYPAPTDPTYAGTDQIGDWAAWRNLALTHLNQLNLSGYTGLRIHISGGKPTGMNGFELYGYDSELNIPEELVLCWKVVTPTPTPSPT